LFKSNVGDFFVNEPKVLIVDDEPVLQRAIQIALKNEGYRLFVAGNGEEGVEIFNKENPDLVFLDLMMPVMNGFDFLQAIDIQPDSPFTVIVMTGHGCDEEIEKCYESGITFFLKKPLSMVEICGLANRCIENSRLRTEREKLQATVQRANETIRQLKAYLIFCAACKRVRDSNGHWHKLDACITTLTDSSVSHGICGDCVQKLYPELYEEFKEKMTQERT